MNARDQLKPKSIRLAILSALSDGAIATIDDLQTKIDEPRKKVANNVFQAVVDGLTKRLRDDVTGGPAYQITTKGRAHLEKFADGKSEEPQAEETSHITPSVKADIPTPEPWRCKAEAVALETLETTMPGFTAEVVAQKDAEIGRLQSDKEVLVRNANQTFDAMRGQQERIAKLEAELGQARTIAQLPEQAISLPEQKTVPMVELISEESFIVKVGDHEFPRMRLVSSWEGMRKLGNPEGHWMIVMKTAGPLGGFFEDVFRSRESKAGEKVIPVCGSDYFQKAFEQVSGGENDTQVQPAA